MEFLHLKKDPTVLDRLPWHEIHASMSPFRMTLNGFGDNLTFHFDLSGQNVNIYMNNLLYMPGNPTYTLYFVLRMLACSHAKLRTAVDHWYSW